MIPDTSIPDTVAILQNKLVGHVHVRIVREKRGFPKSPNRGKSKILAHF